VGGAALDPVAVTVARDEIRQLAFRYARCVDSRDLDGIVGLFVEDVYAGHWGEGRPGLRRFYDHTLRGFRRSVHFVGNHWIELDDADHAHGAVYCKADHETADHWFVAMLEYNDTYERHDDRWYFRQRKLRSWYQDVVDLEGATQTRSLTDAKRDPTQYWDTWTQFWAAEPEPIFTD